METMQVIWQAQILALQAEIEAMKAENAHREMQGYSQAYGEEYFFGIASTLNQMVEHMKSYG